MASPSPLPGGSTSPSLGAVGHSRPRPIRSCTHCRQQKIKCNALEVFPAPCTRCARTDRKCVVDPLFKPHKGGQVQSLRDDISHLKQQLAELQQRESILASVLEKTASTNPDAAAAAAAVFNSQNNPQNGDLTNQVGEDSNNQLKQLLQATIQAQNTTPSPSNHNNNSEFQLSSKSTVSPPITSGTTSSDTPSNSNKNTQINSAGLDSTNIDLNSNKSINSNISLSVRSKSTSPLVRNTSLPSSNSINSSNSAVHNNMGTHLPIRIKKESPKDTTSSNGDIYSRHTSVSTEHPDYVVGDVRLSYDQAEELHQRFMTQYLPFLPIIQSNSAAELYQQSQLLFWTVCLTASLSEPTPTLYNSLCSLIKQLAIETCWIQTPRSTHIVQALLILGNWPLPNEKVLDDCSYRFITLAKSLAMQLGLHRGKFIYEFSRTQVSLPDAEKWRTRTWIAIFFMEQVWCANLGLPPNMPMDYLLEVSRTDTSLPQSFRSLACLAMFCSKLVNLMGSSVTSPDGTLEPKNRFSTLGILEQELDRLVGELGTDNVFVEIYSLYLKMMICVFSFLPETPIQDQTIYIIKAYHAATRVVTLVSGLAEKRRIIEYPIYIRHPVSLAAFILFRLHLSPLLLPQYVESARQSVVTVHRLFRNMLTAWKDVQNDISRTAKVLEKLNFVIITHPELFTKAPGIVTRMRSHLTASLFYELIWAIHEARRRGGIGSSSTHAAQFVAAAAAAAAAQAGMNNNGTNNNNNGNTNNNNNNNNSNNPLGNLSQFSFNTINSMPGSHVDSVPPLPFYNQITKDDFTTTTTTTPNGTTVTTLVPTHSNISYQNNNEGKVIGDYNNGPDGSMVNTTPLAGLGDPSTMLATGGPDAAGTIEIDNTVSEKTMSQNDNNNNSTTNQNNNNNNSNNQDTGNNNYNNNNKPVSDMSQQILQQLLHQHQQIQQQKQVGGNFSTQQSETIDTSNIPIPMYSQNQVNQQRQDLPPPQQQQQQQTAIAHANTPFYDTTGSSSDPLHLDTLIQGIDWMDTKGDDLLGWMDNLDFNF